MEYSKLSLVEINRVCDEFESAWLAGNRPDLKSYLAGHSSSVQEPLAIALLEVDLEYRTRLGEALDANAYESCGSQVVTLARGLLERLPSAPSLGDFRPRLLREDFDAATKGRYRLLEPAGTGGMGTVWKAMQLDPVKRLVAVKFLRADRQSADSKLRFLKERQLLASLKHSHIPAFYDGGETESGQPFLVMELIEGTPITNYCTQHSLGFRKRLELAITICRTLHYAHERGTVHRDIKPTNVLLEQCQDKVIPKVIDFGFAKSTRVNQEYSGQSVSTECGKLIGTLPYISPEQASMTGSSVDRRSDIYSVGVLIYELITGAPPLEIHNLKHQAVWQTLELIRRVDPERPSSRTKRVANWQPQLQRRLASELDWIILKALEKSPKRRYQTAEQLALDLERFLNHEPVLARSHVLAYRARKFCFHHRWWIVTTVFVSVMVLIGCLMEAKRQMNPSQLQNSMGKSDTDPTTAQKKRSNKPKLNWVNRILQHMNSTESCVSDLRVVPYVDGICCYFSDSQAEGDYLVEYRRKWANAPGIVEWEPWARVPVKLTRGQLRGAISDFRTSFPLDGSFEADTVYQLKIRRLGETASTQVVETRTLPSFSQDSPLTIPPKQSLTYGGEQKPAGELRCPGLFRNDQTGTLTNYLWTKDAMPRNTSVKLTPGSLMLTKEGRSMIGISCEGQLFVIQEEAGRLRNWKCPNGSQHRFAPQRLVCTANWRAENLPLGAFAVNQRGQVVNFHWVHDQGFRFQTIEGSNAMVPGSLMVAANQQLIYGVDTNNQLTYITSVDGALKCLRPELSLKLVPGSLICFAKQGRNGDDEGTDLYAVDTQQRLVHLYWVNGNLKAAPVANVEKVIAGSLTISANGTTLFGVRGNTDTGIGTVFRLGVGEKLKRQGTGEMEYPVPMIAGSLVFGDESQGKRESTGRSAPGLYGVDVNGNVVNFRRDGSDWTACRIRSATAIPGTMIRHPMGQAIYAISSEGKTLEISQQSNHFLVRDLDKHPTN